MDEASCYYHVTDEKNARRILREGCIRPLRGENRKLIDDEREGVFLCEWQDVSHWQVLLAKRRVIRVPKSDVTGDMENHMYCGKYGEWLVKGCVRSNCMELLPETPPSVEAQKALCKSHIWYISHTCRWYDAYYGDGTRRAYELDALVTDTRIGLTLLNRLDYGVLDEADWDAVADELQNDCMIAFYDWKENGDGRLWEYLVRYPEDASAPVRRRLYDHIVANLQPILYR